MRYNQEFCTEMIHFRKKKKKDKISLGSKPLTKLMRDAGNSNGDNLFVHKPQTRTTVFKGFQIPLLPTAAFELFQMPSLSTATFELSGFQMPPLSTAAIDTLKTWFHILRYVCRSLFGGPCKQTCFKSSLNILFHYKISSE